MPTEVILWFGGQTSSTLAAASPQSGDEFSLRQIAEQQSPGTVLPSSHSSPAVTIVLPQPVKVQFESLALVESRGCQRDLTRRRCTPTASRRPQSWCASFEEIRPATGRRDSALPLLVGSRYFFVSGGPAYV